MADSPITPAPDPLPVSSRRRWLRRGALASTFLVVAVVLLLSSVRPPEAVQTLHFDFVPTSGWNKGTNAAGPQLVQDNFRPKYSNPGSGARFHVTCDHDTSILVWESGVQVRTGANWETQMQDYRGEIWHLKAGVAREVCLERPYSSDWRAYLRYSSEIKGLALLKVQLREAWRFKSFTNWNGKSWGGGRYYGTFKLLSDPVEE